MSQPINALIIPVASTKKNAANIDMPVIYTSTYASGTEITHKNTLSNKNVIIVFPPQRIVKYVECKKPLTGIIIADILIIPAAIFLTSSVVL